MSTPLRLFIAIVFALLPGLWMSLDVRNVSSVIIYAAVAFGGGGLMFFLVLVLTPSKKELQLEEEAEEVEEYHDNGQIKITGKIIRGKKEQKWRHYDERGKLHKIEVYNDGHLMRTIEGDDL